MTLSRPELGILVNSTCGKGYLRSPSLPKVNNIATRKHHALTIWQGHRSLLVMTTRRLIDFVIMYIDKAKVNLNSPHLVSLVVHSCFGGRQSIALKFRDLVLLDTYKVPCNLRLRHIRMVRAVRMSCRLKIVPRACLEILMMPQATGLMHSTSSSYRLLVTFAAGIPKVPYIRKNKEPIITVRESNTIVRREPGVIKIRSVHGKQMGYLVEEKTTSAIIIPPKCRKEQTRVMGSRRYLSNRDPLRPMSLIFRNARLAENSS